MMELTLLNNEPALLIREGTRRILIVADLHMGYEHVLLKQQQFSLSLSEAMIQHIKRLTSSVKASEVIILGDVKHSVSDFSQSEFHQVAQMLHRLKQIVTITVIRGNHDADIEMVLPDEINMIPSSGMKLSFQNQSIYLTHGHAQPGIEILNCDNLIMAHVHPTIAIPSLKDRYSFRRVWLRTSWKPTIMEAVQQWFKKDVLKDEQQLKKQLLSMRILVMPAFSNLLRGHAVNRKQIETRLGTPLYMHLEKKEAELILLDLTPLGKLKHHEL